jgi:chorismate mutase / prephenate dehydratase
MKYKIAYQGIAGAYSEEAIIEFSQKHGIESERVPSKNFRDLFDKINDETNLGFVPIENSNAGSVAPCYDLFLEYDFEIIGEYLYRVNHNLMARDNDDFKALKHVYSHPQALAQCSKFIEENDFDAIEFSDTASAAKFVSECDDKAICAIASKSAAMHYNLRIIKENIENSDDNTTRFLLVKKRGTSFDFESRFPR